MTYFANNVKDNILEVSATVAAMTTIAVSPKIYDESVPQPKDIKGSSRGFVPWGEDNDRPNLILEKMQKDETLSSNLLFNVLTGYGAGFTYKMKNDAPLPDEIKRFFRRNRPVKYWLEQFTDMKHFFFTVVVVILDKQGEKVTRLIHKEAKNARFEACDPKTGVIENVFFTNWKENQDGKDAEKIPLLDDEDPITDLLVRLGKEPGKDGKTMGKTKDRKFAIAIRFPIPGYKYYSFPYFWSHFNSGWNDIKAMIALGKKAKMTNGMQLKYLVEFHPEYFDKIYRDENITDPAKQKQRITQEKQNIRDFLTGIENSGKMWLSGFYIDPVKGTEIPSVKITNLAATKEGGDWNEDIAEAIAMQCYAMGVHPSLVGAVPGKSKNINGTEARELFTIKQCQERPFRDLMMLPIELVLEVNGWNDLECDIPDLMLTTLDQGTDAKPVTSKTDTNDTK